MTVTLDLLFPHLDDLIQTPADVQRLNEAILQLAVQGKLVGQDPGDEPARELLKRIGVEKERSDRNKSLLPLSDDENPFVAPVGWAWAKMAELSHIVSGVTKGRNLTNQTTISVPYLRVANVQRGYLDLSEIKYIDIKADELDKYLLQDGDLLLTEGGDADKVGRSAIWRNEISGCIHQNHIFRARPVLQELYVDWLTLCTNSQYGKDYFLDSSKQTTNLASINSTQLKNFPVPLPPLAEQKRIVAKVDELFAQSRALAAKLRRAQEAIVVVNRAVLHQLHRAADNATFQHATQILGDHFDLLYTDPRPVTDLRQTILQLAVQGKLVPQDPEDEPAGELLKRIEKERRRLVEDKKLQDNQPLPQIRDNEKPFVLPVGWAWVRFGEAVFNRDSERIPLSRAEREHRQGKYDYYGASGVIDSIDKYLFDKPLLLIGEDGANLLLRSKQIAFIARGKYWVNNHAHVLDSLNEDILQYLAVYINAIDLSPYVTGTAQPKMNQAKMNSIVVALPPLAEQKRIVAKVDELLARCAALERKLGQAQGAGRQLTAAVLHGVVG